MGSPELILLDTHVLVWLDEASPRLGKAAIAKIDKAIHSGVAMVSAISFWEVGMLVRKGRIRLDVDLGVWRRDFLEQGLTEVPLTGDVGIQASCFDGFHGDPADRLIAATALQNTAVLVTADERLLACELVITRLDARI